MPSTSDEREFGISSSLGPKRTQLDVHFTATFTTTTEPIQCRFADRAPGDPAERSRHEIRVLSGSGAAAPALVIGVQLRGRSAGRGFTETASKVSTIDPPAIDDDPRMPRNNDHTASRTWAVAAADGTDIVQHSVVLDVACDALGDYVVSQRAVVQTDRLLEVAYVLVKAGAQVGTGVVRLETSATVEGGLVLGTPVVDDDFT